MSLIDGFLSLGRGINTVRDKPQEDGAIEPFLPELELSMSDEELIELKREWEKQWQPYSKAIAKIQDDNESYWLGQQYNASNEGRPLVDNLIFESLETFLPIATRPKADPIVESDNTERNT